MTSVYSSISIETEPVMHFTVYKIITFYENGMLHALNHVFAFSLIEILPYLLEAFILDWLL